LRSRPVNFGIGGGITSALLFFNRSETPVTPVIAPSSTPASTPTIEKHETIIREKSTEFVQVPVAPAAKPNIDIPAPSAQPSAAQLSASPA
jgi:hypothetical protein